MRRQLLLLGGLAAAVALAVLLRTATPGVEPIAVADRIDPVDSAVAVVADADCAIAGEQTPGLVSSDAAHPLPLVPLADADRIFVAASDLVRATPALLLDFERPPQQHLLSRAIIRPPPLSHTA